MTTSEATNLPVAAFIRLTGKRAESIGAVAIFDAIDLEWICQNKWNLNAQGYATVGKWDRASRRVKTYKMHRLILGLVDPKIHADHIDGNRLNNCRSNLRTATSAQNAQNLRRKGRPNNTTGFRGVYLRKECKGNRCWQAMVQLDRRLYRLGQYDSAEEAARVVSAWRAENMPYSHEDLANVK